jgi:hypothetical protein
VHELGFVFSDTWLFVSGLPFPVTGTPWRTMPQRPQRAGLIDPFGLFLDQVVAEGWDVAFAALFGRCPTDLAIVLSIACPVAERG